MRWLKVYCLIVLSIISLWMHTFLFYIAINMSSVHRVGPSSALAMGESLDETPEEELWDLLTCHRCDSCISNLKANTCSMPKLLYNYIVFLSHMCQFPPSPIWLRNLRARTRGQAPARDTPFNLRKGVRMEHQSLWSFCPSMGFRLTRFTPGWHASLPA